VQEIGKNLLCECLSALFQLLLVVIQLFNLLKILLNLLGLSESGLVYFDADVQNFVVIDYGWPRGLYEVLGVQVQHHLHFIRGP
jgi:hypothetical protein